MSNCVKYRVFLKVFHIVWVGLSLPLLLVNCSTSNEQEDNRQIQYRTDSGDEGDDSGVSDSNYWDGSDSGSSTDCNEDEGSPPNCADYCGSDEWYFAACMDGQWRCEEGLVAVDDCPPDTCWGPPGICDDN